MRTQMGTRVQRLEARLRTLEEARFAQWLRACPTEDLRRYIADETEGQLELLETLSNEQLLRLYNGESFSAVLSQESESANADPAPRQGEILPALAWGSYVR